MNQRRTRRTGVFRRVWRWMLNPDAVVGESTDDRQSRMLTREERRAFEREQRRWTWGIVAILALSIAAPLAFLVVEVFDSIETRERTAREANHIPPR